MITNFISVPFPPQLEDDSEEENTDEEEHEEDEEKEASEDEDGEESSLPGDPDEDVSTATRAKQLAERLKTKARKVLRDLWKMLAIGLLALAGRICVTTALPQVHTCYTTQGHGHGHIHI